MIRSFIGVGAVAACIASSAQAGVVAPNFQIGFADGFNSFMGPAQQWGSFNQIAPTVWRATGSMYSSPTESTLTWHMMVDPDPFIQGTFTVSNDSSATREYVVDFILPIAPEIPDISHIAGSVSGTVTDSNGDGMATLASTGGGSHYNAFIDGVPVQTLLTGASFAVSTAFGSTSFGPASFGYPIGSVTGPGASTSIALQFRFSLSAGDTASFSSIFVVNPVPAPGAIALLAIAGACVRRRRR
jgi:MYXO-CTERM domain-containing protein